MNFTLVRCITTGGWLSRRANIAVNRVQSQFQPIGNRQLMEDAMQMVFHGLLGDGQLLGDFLVPEALRDCVTTSNSRWLSGERCHHFGLHRGSTREENCRITATMLSESSQISPA